VNDLHRANDDAALYAFWRGRRVAMTGASGFVGHHLALLLRSFGADVIALVRASSRVDKLQAAGVQCVTASLADAASLAGPSAGCEFFFHLAGAVDFDGDWQRFHKVNVIGTENVVQAARLAGVPRFVHTSSIVAVGASARPVPLDETAVWNLEPLRIPYVTTKRRAEELALAAAGRGLDVVVVNPGCVLGPGDFAHSAFGTLCKRFWRRRIPFYFGGGSNYVDVRDVARAHLLAAMHGRSGTRYLLGGHNLTAHAFFAALGRTAERPIVRVRLPNALAGAIAWIEKHFLTQDGARAYLTPAQTKLLDWYFFFDSAKARRELGFTTVPLAQTLLDAHAFWMKRKTCQTSGLERQCA